jgi:hypothetical protein
VTLVQPNKTVLAGRVRAIRPGPGGRGSEVELEVLANESPSAERDFLRPALGSVLTAFAADPPAGVRERDLVRVEASLLAGPGGGRAVIQSIERRSPRSRPAG